MSIQATINKSFYDKLDAMVEKADEEGIRYGKQIVAFAVNISPEDTGAYIDSFSVVRRGSSGGRSRTSNNRSKSPGIKGETIARLQSSVAAFKPSETGGFTLTNRAPHSRAVEYKHGYLVFEQTRARFS